MSALQEKCDNYKCNIQCKFQCNSKFNSQQLKSYNEEYSELSNDRKRDFIKKYVTKEENKRNFNYKLYGESVCSEFFIKTLNTNMRFIKYTFERLNSKSSESQHWRQHNKEFVERLESFILSKNPQHSHYNLNNTPNKRYIMDMTATNLYKEFAFKESFTATIKGKFKESEKNIEKCTFSYFYRKLHQMNIGFKQNSNDLCKDCELHKLHEIECESQCECEDCANHDNHIKSFTIARKLMQNDSNTANTRQNCCFD